MLTHSFDPSISLTSHFAGDTLFFIISTLPGCRKDVSDWKTLTLSIQSDNPSPVEHSFQIIDQRNLKVSFLAKKSGHYTIIGSRNGTMQFNISNIYVFPGPVHVPSTRVSPLDEVQMVLSSALVHV